MMTEWPSVCAASKIYLKLAYTMWQQHYYSQQFDSHTQASIAFTPIFSFTTEVTKSKGYFDTKLVYKTLHFFHHSSVQCMWITQDLRGDKALKNVLSHILLKPSMLVHQSASSKYLTWKYIYGKITS